MINNTSQFAVITISNGHVHKCLVAVFIRDDIVKREFNLLL